MTVLRLRYVHRFRDRHGKVRHYFRRDGRRVALPGLPGSTEFQAAYAAALAGKPARGGKVADAGSLAALIVSYYRTAKFRQLAPTTAATYRRVLERLREAHGDKPVKLLQARHVGLMMDARADTPAAANTLLKVIRILMRLAVKDGWRPDNPAERVEKLRETGDGFHAWSEAEIEAFEARWPVGCRQRLAFGLLLYTGQRRGDVIRLGRQHFRGEALAIVQRKTGARLLVPVHAELRRLLDLVPAGQMGFLLTTLGKPFTDNGAGNWFRKACDAAGLPECSAHGLRKAAARRLAEAGCTPHEIQAITGHASLAEVTRYTKSADQERMAVVAMSRIGKGGQAPN